MFEPFIPCISSIELLFLFGEEAKQILFGKDIERLSKLFS
jgi:hypothetical protein